MRLTVFNGSPRGKNGNTAVLLQHFIAGWEATPGNTHEMFYLRRVADAERFVDAFAGAEYVLLAFPLYTDAMPGIVKAFIESLEPLCDREDNPAIGFLVQSGFPEATHSRHVAKYLRKLASRLGCRYLDTIVKGGCEGARWMPKGAKLFVSLRQIGQVFGASGAFDPALLHEFARPERYPRLLVPVFKVFLGTKAASAYWDNQLKKNGAYERRFARPYAE
jgi:hypothetical protein